MKITFTSIKRNSQADCRMVSEPKKTIDGLDRNGLTKGYALSMEDKMAARAFGRARNYG